MPIHRTDAAVARKFGAKGIGLCRTEHMFFEGDTYQSHARNDSAERRRRTSPRTRQAAAYADAATSKVSSKLWTDLGVTIRLLDPPLHEFVPHRIGHSKRIGRRDGYEHRRK